MVALVGTSAFILAVKNACETVESKADGEYSSVPLRKIFMQSSGFSGTDFNFDEKNVEQWKNNQFVLERANKLQSEGSQKAAEEDYKGALDQYNLALNCFKQYPGVGCLQVVSLLQDKARIENDLGMTAEREKSLRLLVEAATQTYNPRHQQVASALESLGDLLSDADRQKEALPLLERAYDIRVKGAGMESGDTAYTMSLLAHCQLDLKNYAKADELYKKAISIYQGLDGEGYSESQQIARENLTNSYRWQNRYKDAMDSDMAVLAYLKTKKLDNSVYAGDAYCSAASTAQSMKDRGKMKEYLSTAEKIADSGLAHQESIAQDRDAAAEADIKRLKDAGITPEVDDDKKDESVWDYRRGAELYSDIGNVYDYDDDLKGELAARQKSLDCLQKLKYPQSEDHKQIAQNLVRAGYCSFKLKDMTRAKEYYGQVLAQARKNQDMRLKLKDNKKQIEEYLQYIEKDKRAHQDADMQMQAHELKELFLS